MTLLMREREKYKEGFAEGEAMGEARGRIKELIDFTLDLGYSSDEIISTLQKRMKISRQQAEEYLRKFHEDSL